MIRSLLAWAIFLLMWWLASCGYQRSSQQHQVIQEAARSQWQETTAETRTESRNEAKTEAKKKARQRVHLRRDGTPRMVEIELEDSIASFLVHSGAFVASEKQAAAASEAQRKEIQDKLSANSVKAGLPWWVWGAIGLVVAGVLYACYRRFRPRLPW